MRSFVFLCVVLVQTAFANLTPTCTVHNPSNRYGIINSVDYHPKEPLCCVTLTHLNQVILYQVDADGSLRLIQTLKKKPARLSEPDYALFSRDGKKLIVANWTSQTLNVYSRKPNGLFKQKPDKVMRSPKELVNYKPHGVSFSPCGKYLAIAYGAAAYYGKAVALFHVKANGMIKLADVLYDVPGIPKGITFSPDGASILVTFADLNSIAIFDLLQGDIIARGPRQVITGIETQISRPEDIKIAPNGKYCAVTNSDQDTVTFYHFDPLSNCITQSTPCYILQNPESELSFPHGITFSPDGLFFLVTQFGAVDITEYGDITWGDIDPKQARLSLYQLQNFETLE